MDVKADPWGMAYKIVTEKLGALRLSCFMNMATMEMDLILLTLPLTQWKYRPFFMKWDIPLFSEEELGSEILEQESPGNRWYA